MMWWVEKAFELKFKNKKIAILVHLFKTLKPTDCVTLNKWFARAIIEALRIEHALLTSEALEW